MTTAYTSLLGLALPVTGELSGTWGDTVNNSITSLLDSAVAGTTTLSADTTLTTTTGAANQARQAILLCTGHSANITITAPAQSKIYTVINASATYTVKIRGAGPTTGITIPVSSTATVAWNGSDFVDASTYVNGNKVINGNLTVNGNTTLGDASGDTITINGTATFANVSPTLTAGTAGGVAYLSNPGKVLTTGSALTFDGTNLGVGLTNPSAYLGKLAVTGNFAITTGNKQYLWDSSNASGSYIQNAGSSGNIALTFGAYSGGGDVEYMRLTSTGLGIGTSSPAYKLDVLTSPSSASYNGINLKNGANSTVIAAYLTGSAYSFRGIGANQSWLYSNVGNFNLMSDGGAITLSTGTNSGVQATLDSSGNLGLGVTPSGWKSTSKAIQINTTGGVSSDSTYGTAYSDNVYLNSSAQWIRLTGNGTTTGLAAVYGQANGIHYWYNAPVGSAGTAATLTQAMTLDASGNWILGGTTARTRLTLQAGEANAPTLGTASGGAFFGNSNVTYGTLFGTSGAGYGWIQQQRVDGSATAYDLCLQPSGGNLLVGTTSRGHNSGVNSFDLDTQDGSFYVTHSSGTPSGYYFASFGYSSTSIGNITQNGTTAVAYNTTSDYRLKDNQQPLTGSGAFIDALKPKTWEWKTDGSKGVGFIAHEVQEVSPNSVTGEKDAIDADGKPVMQSMEYGSAEFIANIIAELQSLRKRLATLEAK